MRCVALENGHDNVAYRSAGEEFDVPNEKIGKDGNPVDGSTWYVAKKKAKAEPDSEQQSS